MKEINLFNAKLKQPEGRTGKHALDEPAVYEFQVAQSLSEHWAAWFDGLEFARDDQGNTLIRGILPDQAALHGVLTKIRDLNLVLLAVRRK